MSQARPEILLDLLRDCFADEIAHLELRLIRDAQAPRFEKLKETHPEIYRDFVAARTGPHELLLANRRKRVQVLTELIEAGAAGSVEVVCGMKLFTSAKVPKGLAFKS